MLEGMPPPPVLDLVLRSYLQEAAYDSESELHNIVENSIDGFVMVDPAGYIVMWNPGQERITGVSASEALGTPVWDMVWALTPELRRDPAAHACTCRRLHSALGFVNGDFLTRALELEIERPSGELRIVQQFAFVMSTGLTAHTVPNSGGESGRRLGCIFHDVTDFRQVAVNLLRRNAELNLLHRINGVLASSIDLEQVRKTVLKEVLQLQHATAASIWLADECTGALACVQSLDHAGGAVPASALAQWRPLVTGVVARGEFALVPDRPTALRRRDEGTLVCVPIKFGDRILGVLLLVHDHPVVTTAAEADVLESIATAAGAAFENVRLYQKAQELALLQERQRLAASLHDAINQSLFSAAWIADALPRLIERDPAGAAASVQDLRLLLRGAAADLRSVLAELQPSLIEHADFGDLLSTLAAGYTGRTSTTVAVKIGAKLTFPARTQTNLYCLCREAISNIAKHADATQVWVELARKPHGVQLRIRDNGRGMDLGSIPPGHFGLLLMQQQAAEVGAEFHITSAVGHGTELSVFIPEWNQG